VNRPAELLAALRREDLLRDAPPAEILEPMAGIATDSRQVGKGALFVAVRGSQLDGHRFVGQAVERGALAVVVEQRVDVPVPQVIVRDGRRAAIALARAWYHDPAAELGLYGVTGTNGKTTTVGILAHLLNRLEDAGTIGTLGAFDGARQPVESIAGSLTTPGPVDLHATLAALRDRGVRQVAMETSSHSLDQGRLDGLAFRGVVFTNLTQDHLDYHGTMEHYRAAKLRLLGLRAKEAVTALNADDPAWAAIPRNGETVTFGLRGDADVRAALPAGDATGCRFRIEGRFGTREVAIPLPGGFNIANALAASACALGTGMTLGEVADRLATAPQIPGRLERIVSEPWVVLRDYAHTPDALERVLETLRPLTPGRLLVVFGCGGDRDRGKRPLMGRIAGTLADFVVVTSDNPRTEDPERIIDDIVAGLPSGVASLREADRRVAIREALSRAVPGDAVLLAGKGHETYQVLGTEKVPFDERAIVLGLLGGPAGGAGALD
jgi:UDP-N-acetylmuramoyl-L-alanyl-D-glutamate--2,6-diaminopimelate ligase